MILLSSYPDLIYPKVSFHGFALPPSALFLDDAVAMGGVCWSGLWLKVCLSGPKKEKRNEDRTFSTKPKLHHSKSVKAQ